MLSFSFVSYGQNLWPKSAVKLVKNFTYPFHNSFVGTIWSSCRAKNYRLNKIKNTELLDVEFNNSYYESGKVRIKIALQRNNTDYSKAPIAIVINGIFGNQVSGLARQLGKVMLETGYHVIFLGNPLGVENIVQKPKYPLGHFIEESHAYLETLKSAVNWISEKQLNTGIVRLIGVSYGSFTAAIMTALDSKEDFPIIFDTTLLSPPIEMASALKNMDQILIDTKKYGGRSKARHNLAAIRFCLYNKSANSSQKVIDIAKSLFGYSGFQNSLVESTILADNIYNIGKIPTSKKDFKTWKRNFFFKTYLNEYASELRYLMFDKRGTLKYWIDKIRLNNKLNLRVFTSLDDPLNLGESWNGIPNVLSTERGGHYGLRSFLFYEKFLMESFRIH